MIERLVKEIRICLGKKCYIAALTTAITLPDICGRAEYPKEKAAGKRFKQWFSQYVYSEKPFGIHMSEDIAYSLRCKLLHEGNPSIDKGKCRVNQFALMIRENSCHIPLESSQNYVDAEGNIIYSFYNVNLIELCSQISNAALRYFQNNKEKFDFFDFRITSVPDDTARSLGLKENLFRVDL